MKRVIFLFVFLSICLVAESKTKRLKCVVEFPSRDNGVVIDALPEWVRGATVWCDGEEIPSQLDDLDDDGRPDELAFVYEGMDESYLGVSMGERALRKEFQILLSSNPIEHNYQPRVNAQMWLKNADKSLEEVTVASSFKDDMYRKLHHHGPAFESERAAYRVYFDKKQSIDTYGKKSERLELRETNWYTTDEQLARGYGHDNIRVFGSISVGVLKGWDARRREMTHITEMRRREARIRAAGPVRTIVDMRVEGWRYRGREIDMTSRYILFAGHTDVRVENHLSGDLTGLEFTTGVMKIRDGYHATLRDSVLLSTGSDYPENDSVRWERERVMLAVALPGRQIVGRADDKKSHLVQLAADSRGRIDYRLWMFWQKSEWLNSEDWLSPQGMARMGGWSYEMLSPVIVELK